MTTPVYYRITKIPRSSPFYEHPTLKLKVEINTREHASLLGVRRYPFAVENDWYRGTAQIASFEPEELNRQAAVRAMLESDWIRSMEPFTQNLVTRDPLLRVRRYRGPVS